MFGTYIAAGPDGLPPHEPDDDLYREASYPWTVHDLTRPRRPEREVDLWEYCPHCGEDICTGTRELTDREYADAVTAYEKDLNKWRRTGGKLAERTGPVEHRCTITSADRSFVAEYVGNGEIWKILSVQTQQTPAGR
jgi:hypothetical protein